MRTGYEDITHDLVMLNALAGANAGRDAVAQATQALRAAVRG